MSTFNTIHVFGFGDTQVIGKDQKGTVKSQDLTKLSSFVDAVKALKPSEVVESDYHVIHIFNNGDVKYLGKSNDRDAKTNFIVKTLSLIHI